MNAKKQVKRAVLPIVYAILTGFHTTYASSPAPAGSYLEASIQQEWDDDRHFDPGGTVDAAWWRGFGDPTLDSLISIGLENNYNVLISARRITIARNALNTTRGQYLPTISMNAGWEKEQSSGLTAGRNGHAATLDYWQGSIDMSWEIDLFGRISTASKAKKAQWQASRAEYAGVMLSLEAEIATTYASLRAQQAQLAVAREHSLNQKEVVGMTEARYESGLASMLDVTQARRVYYSTIASIPMLESQIKASVNALAVLTAQNPQQLTGLVSSPSEMPGCIQIISTGLPLDLLTRRPDIAAAREQIDAAAASVGISKKEYLPSLRIDGSIGTQAHNAGDLFSKQSFTYSVAPTISWTIFDGLGRKYALADAREQLQSAIDSYNLTVLTAVTETDNAMDSYLANLQYITSLEEVVEQCKKSLKLAIDLYKLDLSAFTNVVDAQMTYLANQNTLITARHNALTSLIAIYKALGGGWDYGMLYK